MSTRAVCSVSLDTAIIIAVDRIAAERDQSRSRIVEAGLRLLLEAEAAQERPRARARRAEDAR